MIIRRAALVQEDLDQLLQLHPAQLRRFLGPAEEREDLRAALFLLLRCFLIGFVV